MGHVNSINTIKHDLLDHLFRMALEGGIVIICNSTGRDIYLAKNRQSADPWQFVDDNGNPGVRVIGTFVIPNGRSVTLTVGSLSADADNGSNFYSRWENNNDAAFANLSIYCSGEVGDIQRYWFVVNDFGLPVLTIVNPNE